MPRALLLIATLTLTLVALRTGAARADDFEDLGNCREEVYGGTDKLPARTITIERDARHRVVKQTTVAGSAKLVQTRSYDDKGRLATVYIGDVKVVNEYEPKTGRLVRSRELDKAGKPTRVWTREYDAAGRLAHEVAREGDRYTIDKVFTYDKVGRLATIAMDHGATTEAHTYDERGRLIRNDVVISKTPYRFTYRYDDKGRRLEQAGASGRIAYSYDCH